MDRTVHVRWVTWSTHQVELSRIRHVVFIEEQQVPAELEFDEHDLVCAHALAQTSDGAALATGRLLADGHIGRVAVLREARGRGVGSLVLRTLMGLARERGLSVVQLHAQVAARAFYERHGFVVTSAEYLEVGIPHVDMTHRF